MGRSERFPDDEDLPLVAGFSGTNPVTIGDRTCVAGLVLPGHADRSRDLLPLTPRRDPPSGYGEPESLRAAERWFP